MKKKSKRKEGSLGRGKKGTAGVRKRAGRCNCRGEGKSGVRKPGRSGGEYRDGRNGNEGDCRPDSRADRK